MILNYWGSSSETSGSEEYPFIAITLTLSGSTCKGLIYESNIFFQKLLILDKNIWYQWLLLINKKQKMKKWF